MTNPRDNTDHSPDSTTGEAVSVVIPTYNRAHLLPRAIVSVLIALLPQDELIVVDDGSKDRTSRLVRGFADRVRPRVRHFRTKNHGAGAARNFGIRKAQNPLIAFLDSDDEWLPETLELKRAFMHSHPDVVFCCSDFEVRREDGSAHHHGLRGWHRDPRSWDEILAPGVPYSSLAPLGDGPPDFHVHIGDLYAPMLLQNYVATQSAVVRREAAGADLHFAEDVPVYEEWECFARLARRGPAAYFDCETFIQWSHGGTRLTDADAYSFATAQLTLVERVWGRDAEFLALHEEIYRRRVQELHRRRANWMAHHGQMRAARLELQQAGAVPLKDRLLTTLPAPVVRGVDIVREMIRRVGGYARHDDEPRFQSANHA